MTQRPHIVPIVLSTLIWAGCGAGPSQSPTPTAPSAPPPTSGSGGGSGGTGGTGSGSGGGGSNPNGSLTAPTAITVASGQSTSGVDILVPNTASTINIKMLGVNSPGASSVSATNVGGAVARGTTALILMFGSGLNANLKVSISGPNDVTISQIKAVTGGNGSPGIQFTLAVAGNAAVGARTVILEDTSGNASTFTGGLEVY